MLKFAIRSLWRRPTSALVAIHRLVLVIGASTGIFSALYGLVFAAPRQPGSHATEVAI